MTTVLKLGGSVITHKEHERRLATDRLDVVARTLERHAEADLVVIIGGGSFGHPPAERHGISTDIGSTDPGAIAEVHAAMLDLVTSVVDHLIDAGVSAIAFHPLSFARRDGTQLTLSLDAVAAAISEGFVPVIHGDGVLTTGEGVTILSGDDLVVQCAQEFNAVRVGLCTDVPGVLDAEGAVIERITGYNEVASMLGDSEMTDVTGGMAAKVETLLSLKRQASVFDLDGLDRFLDGGQPGTSIVPTD